MVENGYRQERDTVPVTLLLTKLQTGGGGMEVILIFTGQKDYLKNIRTKSTN